MSKTMNNYETIFIVSLQNGEESVTAVVNKFKTLIEENAAAESVVVDEWGKRRLAYPINDLTEGHYVMINFSSDADFPAELDRIYKITEDILRSIIIKK